MSDSIDPAAVQRLRATLAESAADTMATQIARITGQEIGERKHGNDPWEHAIRAAVHTPPVSDIGAVLAEIDRLRAELDQAWREAAVWQARLNGALYATPHADAAPATQPCGCAIPPEIAMPAGAHRADCPDWVNAGPSLSERRYVRRDAEATPDEPAPSDPAPQQDGGAA